MLKKRGKSEKKMNAVFMLMNNVRALFWCEVMHNELKVFGVLPYFEIMSTKFLPNEKKIESPINHCNLNSKKSYCTFPLQE